jgi:hypothetical protein
MNKRSTSMPRQPAGIVTGSFAQSFKFTDFIATRGGFDTADDPFGHSLEAGNIPRSDSDSHE